MTIFLYKQVLSTSMSLKAIRSFGNERKKDYSKIQSKQFY